MERYNRLYKDPKSPLTPLTPLAASMFTFNIENNSPKSEEECEDKENTCPTKRFSKHFAALRNFFENSGESQLHATPKQLQHRNLNHSLEVEDVYINVPKRSPVTSTRKDKTPLKPQRLANGYGQTLPIPAKPLSPRIGSLLENAGIGKLKELFQREEIDTAVLKLMKPEDLKYLGIEDEEDIRRIRGIITAAWKLFR